MRPRALLIGDDCPPPNSGPSTMAWRPSGRTGCCQCRWWLALLSFLALTVGLQAAPSNSIARVWNERALAAIRQDTPHPPAQARNYFSYSVCMYDAWAAYDPVAIGYVYRGKHSAADVASARSNAISYAAWRMLRERHAYSRT